MPENPTEQTVDEAQQTGTPAQEPQEPAGEPQEPETFPRAYVEKLRAENANYRQRAQQADTLSHRLHEALTTATGRLADPTDLPYDEAHLEDPDKLTAAIDGLVARKPHLASRRPAGNIGQGMSAAADTVSLAGILRTNAR